MRVVAVLVGVVLGCDGSPPRPFQIGAGFEASRQPTLAARLVGPERVVIEGEHLGAATRLVVEVAADRARSDARCATAFRREVETSERGTLRFAIEPDPATGCDFTCGPDRAALRVQIGARLHSAPFPCW